jgi:hypothetical protein
LKAWHIFVPEWGFTDTVEKIKTLVAENQKDDIREHARILCPLVWRHLFRDFHGVDMEGLLEDRTPPIVLWCQEWRSERRSVILLLQRFLSPMIEVPCAAAGYFFPESLALSRHSQSEIEKAWEPGKGFK